MSLVKSQAHRVLDVAISVSDCIYPMENPNILINDLENAEVKNFNSSYLKDCMRYALKFGNKHFHVNQ